MRISKREKLYFTDKMAMSLPVENRDYYVGDAAQEHLFLRVHPSGQRAWYFRKRYDSPSSRSNVENRNLGSWPEMTVNEARQIADEMLKALKCGVLPKQFLRQRSWAACTVSDIIRYHIEHRLKPRRTERYTREIERGYERIYVKLLDLRAIDLSRADVEDWHNHIGATIGRDTANKYLTELKAAYEYASQCGMVDLKRLPTKGVEKFPENVRKRYLTPEEFPVFLRALDAESNQDHADVIRLLLFTGVRANVVYGMRWQDIDFAAKQWNCPQSLTNKRNPEAKPFTDDVLDILERRRLSAQPGAVWVFPADSASGHVETIQKVFARVRKAAGSADDFVIHSLRHTFCSMLAQSGANTAAIAAAAGHQSGRTTERYIKMAAATVRAATEAGIARLTRLAPKNPSVVSLRRRTAEQTAALPSVDVAEPAPIAVTAPAGPRPKNADVVVGPTEQTIVEGKILTAIRYGGTTKKAFYKKIGACVTVNSAELERILGELEERGLIYKARRIPGQAAYEYAIRERLQQA